MQYRLIVMRHAKSDWTTNAATDHARPLNKRGRKDAPRIAQKLTELGWQPDVVLSSDSTRTRQTFDRMCEGFNEPFPEVQYLESLYHAGIGAIAEAVAKVPDKTTCVLVLGHNNGWQSAVYTLTGKSMEMTTANAALLKLTAESWEEAIHQEHAWKLIEFLRPKEI